MAIPVEKTAPSSIWFGRCSRCGATYVLSNEASDDPRHRLCIVCQMSWYALTPERNEAEPGSGSITATPGTSMRGPRPEQAGDLGRAEQALQEASQTTARIRERIVAALLTAVPDQATAERLADAVIRGLCR